MEQNVCVDSYRSNDTTYKPHVKTGCVASDTSRNNAIKSVQSSIRSAGFQYILSLRCKAVSNYDQSEMMRVTEEFGTRDDGRRKIKMAEFYAVFGHSIVDNDYLR